MLERLGRGTFMRLGRGAYKRLGRGAFIRGGRIYKRIGRWNEVNWLRFGLSVAPIFHTSYLSQASQAQHFNGQIEHVNEHCELAWVWL